MKPSKSAIERRLRGMKDPRSTVGIMSRGKNIYKGTSHAAHSGGGPQFGRPRKPEARNPMDVYAEVKQRLRRKTR